MANNKFYGYTPKNDKPPKNSGQIYSGREKSNRVGHMTKDGTYANLGNRLDKVNPYEFRKGMDYELTAVGISRLQESTPEEREKATETVLKNLENNHPAYYSALLQFETGMNQGSKITETSFNNFLKTYSLGHGDGMMAVNEKEKNNQMEEPKYDSKLYKKPIQTKPNPPLKESIKIKQLKETIQQEVKRALLEKKGKVKEQDDDIAFDDDEKAADKAATKVAKKAKKSNRFDLEREAIKDLLYRGKKGKDSEFTKEDPAPKSILDIKNQMLDLYKTKYKGDPEGVNKYNSELVKANEKFKKILEKHVEKFGEGGKGLGNKVDLNKIYGEKLSDTIKLLEARLKDLEKEEEADVIAKEEVRRSVAETDMTRAQAIKLLEIIKKQGVSLREGTQNIKPYYEIAKAAYLEGLANGMKI